MKTKSNIMIFDNDKHFLFMLKGYCYANNIQLTEAGFNQDGINEIEKQHPAIIFIPLDWLSADANRNVETNLLRLACESRGIKICALNKRSSDIASAEAPEWIDAIINHPLDITEIDRFLRSDLFCSSCLPERRTARDRRKINDRRQSDLRSNGFNENREKEARDSGYSNHQDVYFKSLDFHVDARNKCLFLKGNRIDLTPKEYELVEYLATDPDRIFTPDEIIKRLWPENHRATKSDLYQYIHLLRKKIEKDHNQPQLILNAKGFGYKLNVINHQNPCDSCGHQVAQVIA